MDDRPQGSPPGEVAIWYGCAATNDEGAIVSDRPTHCQHCQRPHGKSILTASNGRMYTKPSSVIGVNPATGIYEPYDIISWHDLKGKVMYPAGERQYREPTDKQLADGLAAGIPHKDIRGNEIKLKVESEYVYLTKVMSQDGKYHRYLCTYCRSIVISKRTAAQQQSKK